MATTEGGNMPAITCPECGEEVWDGPHGHKLAKCWNTEGHVSGGTLAFDTMTDDEWEERVAADKAASPFFSAETYREDYRYA